MLAFCVPACVLQCCVDDLPSLLHNVKPAAQVTRLDSALAGLPRTPHIIACLYPAVQWCCSATSSRRTNFAQRRSLQLLAAGVANPVVEDPAL